MTNTPGSGGAIFYSPDGKIISQPDDATTRPLGSRPQTPMAQETHVDECARDKGVNVNAIDPDKPVAEQADDLADMIHERFMTMLTDRLQETGGSLNADDVEELSKEFRDNLGDVRDVFINAVDSHTKAEIPRREEVERESTFERLMVQRFENRFAPDHKVAKDATKMSRRMLPGFFNALSLLLGPRRMTRYQEKSTLVRNVLQEKMGNEFSWTKVYTSAHARKIALRAQIDIVRHFDNTDKRVAWLVALVNSNMIPTDPGKPAAGWSFTEDAARQLLQDMFADLAAAISNDAARDSLERELGADGIAQIRSVLQQIY